MMGANIESSKRRRLIVVIIALCAPLLIVKYTNFFYQDILGLITGQYSRLVDWQLPLGISFITFTLIAYVVDVFAGRYRLEQRAEWLAGLVLFFPHLIAGPILRPSELLPQLRRPRRKLGVALIFGIAIFSIGLLKKLVFADPLSEIVEPIFQADSLAFSRLDYILAIYAFAVQIYCDFSGYTDMALGVAMVLGVKLPQNFNKPYLATSLVDFWARWHITLSKWLRDYLYIPLGGNRKGVSRQTFNLLFTMTLGGLWHGASWNFILWGVAHGAGISIVHLARHYNKLKMLTCMPKIINMLITFHFVIACWILFRSPDLNTAWRVATGPFIDPFGDVVDFGFKFGFQIFLLIVFFLVHRWDNHKYIRLATQNIPKVFFWPLLLLIWLLAITVSEGSSEKFIYFDF